MNTFDTIYIYDMPDDLEGIPKTYITDNLKLYILGESKDEYRIFCIDLDRYEDEVKKECRIL